MPAHKPDALDALNQNGREDWTDPQELALTVLETLTAAEWQAIAELAQAHTAGRLSYAAWRTAVTALLVGAARAAWP